MISDLKTIKYYANDSRMTQLDLKVVCVHVRVTQEWRLAEKQILQAQLVQQEFQIKNITDDR